MKIRNPSNIFWVVLRESLGLISRLLSFQYTSIISLKKTHLDKNYIVQWVAKVLACSSICWIFPITLPHLNVGWWYQMVTNLRQYLLRGEIGLASNLLEINYKISVYCIEGKIVIHLLLGLIVQCRYVFFCSKVLHRYYITLLDDHMSRYSSVCQ